MFPWSGWLSGLRSGDYGCLNQQIDLLGYETSLPRPYPLAGVKPQKARLVILEYED